MSKFVWIKIVYRARFFVSDVGNGITCYDCYYKADGGGSENCLYVGEETKYSDCDIKDTNLDACIVRVYFTSPNVYVCTN